MQKLYKPEVIYLFLFMFRFVYLGYTFISRIYTAMVRAMKGARDTKYLYKNMVKVEIFPFERALHCSVAPWKHKSISPTFTV